MAEHSAFLTAWKDLVKEDVRVDYCRDKVEKVARRDQRLLYYLDTDGEDGEAGSAESGNCD